MKRIGCILMVLIIAGTMSCNKEKDDVEVVDENQNVVINELLPKNSQYGSDQDGEFDDWIELYNLSDENIDVSGFYLTDSKKDLTKWKFPEGTVIEKNGFLIVWADGDSLQAGLHTNYKLSAGGENVVLLSPERQMIDLVEYPETLLEQSYARIPNGTGDFKWSTPTFNGINN